MYKKAIVAVDGSAATHRVIAAAREMMQKGVIEELNLLCVVNLPHPVISGDGMAVEYARPEFQKVMIDNAHRVLNDCRAELGEDFAVQTTAEYGQAADVIIEIAEKDEVDLIIIGSRGLSQLQRFLMGSVSTRVVTHALCSVLVVR